MASLSSSNLITTLPFVVSKTITYDGTSGKGAVGTNNLFIVTGDVLINLVGICKVNLSGAATYEVGVVNQTGGIFAQIANASTIVTPKTILSGSNVAYLGLYDATAGYGAFVDGNSQNIIETIGSTNITAGQIVYYCFWKPLSSDGNVIAA